MQFHSFLMIASPRICNQESFIPLGSLTGMLENGSRNYIDVITWNCEDKTGIKPLIEDTLEKTKQALEKNPDVGVLKHNIEALKNYLRLMPTEHDLDPELRKFVINKISNDMGYEFAQDLTDDSFMFLSSVDASTLPKL